MSKINNVVNRRDTKRIIDEDPWTITVYRKGRKTSDPETTWSFTARIFPAGGNTGETRTSPNYAGEHGISYTLDVMLCEWNVAMPKEGDILKAVHAEVGTTHDYIVAHCKTYAYKQEVFLDAKQA